MAHNLKFIQLGGFELVAEALGTGFQNLAHLSKHIAVGASLFSKPQAVDFIAAIEQLSPDFDCLILHLPADSEFAKLGPALVELRSKRKLVCALLYHQHLPDPDFKLGLEDLAEAIDHLFVTSPEFLPHWENASLLACPLPLTRIAEPAPFEPELNNAKLLHIPYLTDKNEQSLVLEAVRNLNNKKDRLLYAILAPQQIASQAELELRLSECDIFVESLSNLSPGPLGLLAMALGKTVITGTHLDLERRWKQLENYPAVKVSLDNFEKKLDAILREHRSMRDFGKRGRKFAASFCAPDSVCAIMLRTVEKLVTDQG